MSTTIDVVIETLPDGNQIVAGHNLSVGDLVVVGPNVFKVLTPPPCVGAGHAQLWKGNSMQRNFQLRHDANYQRLPPETQVARDVPPQATSGMSTTGTAVVGKLASYGAPEPQPPKPLHPPTTEATDSVVGGNPTGGEGVQAANIIAAEPALAPNAIEILTKAAAKPMPNTVGKNPAAPKSPTPKR